MNPYNKWMHRRADNNWRNRQHEVKNDLVVCVRCGFKKLEHFIDFETCNKFKKPFMPTEAEVRQGQRDREIWESVEGHAKRQVYSESAKLHRLYSQAKAEPKKADGVKKATSPKKKAPAKKAPAKKATPAKKKPTTK